MQCDCHGEIDSGPMRLTTPHLGHLGVNLADGPNMVHQGSHSA